MMSLAFLRYQGRGFHSVESRPTVHVVFGVPTQLRKLKNRTVQQNSIEICFSNVPY